MSTSGRVLAALTRVEFLLACLALVVMLGAYLIQVVMRYAFNAPPLWSSDVVAYALCVSVMLALPAVTRDKGHVAITSLVDRMGTARRLASFRWLAWISAAACTGATALMLSQGLAQWRAGIDTVAAFAIPMWWLSVTVAIGLAGAACHFTVHARRGADAALGGEREV